MQLPDVAELQLKCLQQVVGQKGNAVLVAFGFARDDLFLVEIDIVYAQAYNFQRTQTAAVHQLRHKVWRATQNVYDIRNLLAAEYNREACRFAGA